MQSNGTRRICKAEWYFFVDLLRALATALITNSHYGSVYPISILANGGLLGNIIFFAISGFCLSNIKLPFHKWYAKRLIRIYPIVWIVTIFNVIIGNCTISSLADFFDVFVFPTQYHFIGSIMILYIPYYVFVLLSDKYADKVKNKIDFTVLIFILTIATSLMIYLFGYDKSYYHIDTVEEPFIRFLYFESMLIGYYFKQNLACFENKKGKVKWIITVFLFVLYFASKIVFMKLPSISGFQIFNQYAILGLLIGILICATSISGTLEKLPVWIKSIVSHIARITLEIYVVQYIIIARFSSLPFPVNWVVITLTIIMCGTILHYIVKIPSIINKRLHNKD